MVLTKKKGYRAAQRGAVKQKDNGPLESEFRSLCDLLQKKKNILCDMDREILEETADESMEEEIDDADWYVFAIDQMGI